MHLGGVARSAGGAERSSRGREPEGETFLIYMGPEGNPVAKAGSLFPLKLMAHAIQSYLFFKKRL